MLSCRSALGTGFLVAKALYISAIPALASEVLHDTLETQTETSGETELGFGNGSTLVVPLPSSNPTFGTGLALVASRLFTIDEGSDPSYLGVVGYTSSNGSGLYGGGGQLNFGEGRYKTTIFLGRGELFYNFYGVGAAMIPAGIEIRQEVEGFKLAGAVRVFENMYLGAEATYVKTNISPSAALPPPVNALNYDMEILKIGPTFEYDSRDNSFYPTQGRYFNMGVFNNTIVDGPRSDYRTLALSYRDYRSFSPDLVLATQASVCSVSHGAPFFDLCALGGFDYFRGYEVGEFRDHFGLSIQTELRGRLTKRWGYAAFAGVGFFGDKLGEAFDESPAGAVGVGGRYRMSKKYPVDLVADIAINHEREVTTYLYIGQRF